ncbi:MAG TPA: agmatine deiminase family protein [Phycisphaerae bacterium]|nr:agmatine deiminase family protein [Phycisphaerae bacterium]
MHHPTYTYRWSVGLLGAVLAIGPFATPVSVAADEPIRVGDQLSYPEGADIPRSLTQTEHLFLEQHPLQLRTRVTDPPTGPIHCVAEYEPMEALLIAWEGTTSLRAILEQMAVHVTSTGDAGLYVMVDNASEQSTAYSQLASAGVDMNRVQFCIATTDTIWIRDYGPRYIYQGQCRAIVDHIYNRPRPNDDDQPAYFSTYKNHAYYEIPLIHGGGNYHLNALASSHASRLIANENPGLTEQQIHDLWQNYQNVDTTIWAPFPTSVDSTQHIDMWMQIVADDVIIISDWPANPGSTQDQICDNAAAVFAAAGWDVHRTPARQVGGVHYTYTNMVLCNDLVLLPYYTNSTISPYNAVALGACEKAMPAKTIVQINCEAIISSAGAMHCIVMHVPEPAGGQNPTTYLENLRGGQVLQPNTQEEIRWISDDDVAVTDVDIQLSIDGGATFPFTVVSGTADDESYLWTVPNMSVSTARLKVTVHDADAHQGHDESDADLTIDGLFGDYDVNGTVDLTDFAQWEACMTGPANGPFAAGCGAFNADTDTDVDLADFAEFQRAFPQ